MLRDDIKSLVGENCSEFDSKYVFHQASMTNLAQSCLSCYNYSNGQCKKDLFKEVYESIRIN